MKEFITHAELLMSRHLEYPPTEEQAKNLGVLWFRVNALLAEYPAQRAWRVSSGYRPGKYNTQAGGAQNSRHLHCKAVDLTDLDGAVDKWLDENPGLLEKHKLSREHPANSVGWCHLDVDTRGGKYITFRI